MCTSWRTVSATSRWRASALCGENGGRELFDAQRLGQVFAGAGVRLAFLCSCQTALGGDAHFRELDNICSRPTAATCRWWWPPRRICRCGGAPSWAKASTAISPLAAIPSEALVAARREAYDVGGFGWSVPILLSRPAPSERKDRPVTVAGLPARRATYLERPVLEERDPGGDPTGGWFRWSACRGSARPRPEPKQPAAPSTRGLFGRAIHREARRGHGCRGFAADAWRGARS